MPHENASSPFLPYFQTAHFLYFCLAFSNKSYPYDLYPPSSGFDNNSNNRHPYSVSLHNNDIFGPSGNSNTKNTNNNQLSSSSSTSALTSPYHDHDPMLYPYRPSFSSSDRLVTSKPSYYNRPSYNFYRPTTYKPILSQTTLSLSLDSESYPLYPGDVIKFGSAANSHRPLKPYNGNIGNYHTTSPPTPPHPPQPPLPPIPPVLSQVTTPHPYDPLHSNDVYGPIGDHDKYFDKFDGNKYGSGSQANNNGASGGSKISSISPKGK